MSSQQFLFPSRSPIVRVERQVGTCQCDATGFAVIDLETTGLDAQSGHRIVEVAVVHLDRLAQMQQVHVTLVNPQRSMSATEIHRITAADVAAAPTFSQISRSLRELLSNRIVVAHNIRFEAEFLRTEFDRAGVEVPVLPGLDTMWCVADFRGSRQRTLKALTAQLGVPLVNPHTALGDALATGQLLQRAIAQGMPTPIWLPATTAQADLTVDLSQWQDPPANRSIGG